MPTLPSRHEPVPSVIAGMLRGRHADGCCAPVPVPDPPPARPRRATLADLDRHLHCSIIGTCLTTGELRRLVCRFAPHVDRTRATDLEIHHAAVELSCEGGAARKQINKALDTRHAAAIRAFRAAHDAATLRALWGDAMARGEIPGAYWALMTHPCLTPDVRALAFGDVHMLSHLVGASNRADIRRLVALEAECQALREQNARQQARLRDLAVRHADTVRTLEAHVLASAAPRPASVPEEECEELARVRAQLAGRDDEVELHRARCASAERKLADSEASATALQVALDRARAEASVARAEAAAAEQALAALADAADAGAPLPRLDGVSIAYVGGRPGVTAVLARLVAAAGGELLLHDGGVEERKGTLVALLARADLAVFPVDCIGHNAMHTIKRVCEQTSLAYHPVRSAGVAGVVLLLQRLYACRTPQSNPPPSRFCLRHG